MKKEQDYAKPMNVEKTQKKVGRRQFLKDAGMALGIGAGVGVATYGLGNAVIGATGKYIKKAEREVRELALNVQELSGMLEQKLVEERQRLENHYTSGTLRVYEELGIATPAEISEIERIVDNYEDFERHYNFGERAKIFKDRLDAKLLGVDEQLEPKALKGLNDKIRGLFGKKTGKEGNTHRKRIRDRMDALVKIYDANSDNRKAQGEVLEQINDYLDRGTLTEEETALYGFLQDQAKKGNEKDLREFIKNYETFGDRNIALLKLRNTIDRSETLYHQVRENQAYVERLQGLLKEGITLKENVRKTAAKEVEKHREEFDVRIQKLNGAVDGIINELEEKGYNIETRKEYIKRGPIAKAFEDMARPLTTAASVATGGLATLLSLRNRRKVAKEKVAAKVSEKVIQENERLARENQTLKKTIEKQEN